MKFLTEHAVLKCDHGGLVGMAASQSWVTIEGASVLVDNDPEGKPIAACPHVSPTIKPCLLTLKVQQGYSGLVRVGGRRVCLDTVTGLTDGTPPGTVPYRVRNPGQNFVAEGG